MSGWQEGDLGCLDSGAAGFIVRAVSYGTLSVEYASGAVGSIPSERARRPGEKRKAPSWCPSCRAMKKAGRQHFMHDHEFTPNRDKTVWTCSGCGWSTRQILYPTTTHQAQGEPTMSKLFRLIAEENEPGAAAVYVRRVGTDGDLAVVKNEATGALLAVEPKRLEEVLPYTVRMRKVGAPASGNHTHDFIATKGVFKVDDLLMDRDGALWMVGALDTKSREAVKRFRGFKLHAEVIPGGDE